MFSYSSHQYTDEINKYNASKQTEPELRSKRQTSDMLRFSFTLSKLYIYDVYQN